MKITVSLIGSAFVVIGAYFVGIQYAHSIALAVGIAALGIGLVVAIFAIRLE